MRSIHERAGAVFGRVGEVEMPRHYGDPAAEYLAATTRMAVADRSHRTRLAVTGKAPGQMLEGIVTGKLPDRPPERPGDRTDLLPIGAEYSVVLTPKGRVIADLRMLPLAGPDEGFLLDVPVAGSGPLRAHLAKFLPPRMAKIEDASESTGMISVLGPDAAELLAREALGLRTDAGELLALPEGSGWAVRQGDGWSLAVIRSADVDVPAFDVLGDRDGVRTLFTRLIDLEVRPIGQGVWHALRVEAGRPAFGADMDESTIPIEAGVGDRAIDHEKGCYTGQEVIVRIRDRGHVNRYLRGLVFDDGPAPAVGTELWAVSGDKPLGRITSVADSPRAGRVIGLGYVRREVEPPSELRVGSPDGQTVAVRELHSGWASEGS